MTRAPPRWSGLLCASPRPLGGQGENGAHGIVWDDVHRICAADGHLCVHGSAERKAGHRARVEVRGVDNDGIDDSNNDGSGLSVPVSRSVVSTVMVIVPVSRFDNDGRPLECLFEPC